MTTTKPQGLAAAKFANWLDESAEGWLREVERLEESKDTARLAATPSPAGTGGTNYITRDRPGNRGKLPNYLEQVRDGIRKTGKTLSEATAIAISRLRVWASGGGNVSPEVKAAAGKAIAEYEAIGARSKAKTAAKAAAS